jgi:cytochrome c-type biogenesis protein CcmE
LIILAALAVLAAVLLGMWGPEGQCRLLLRARGRGPERHPAGAQRADRRDGARRLDPARSRRGDDRLHGRRRDARYHPVRFTGIAPDLFKENSGWSPRAVPPSGTFVADEILAKHDENYMPPELARDGAKHKTETLQ